MTKNVNTEQEIRDAINLRFHNLEMSYQNFRNNPYSNEHVHRLRVELRKLRAILSFLKPVLDREAYSQVNIELKLFGLKLSKKRDLDTLIEILENTAEKEALLVYNYAAIFGYLEKERLEEANLISNQEAILSFDSIIIETKRSLNALEFKFDKKEHKNLETFITKRFKKKGQKLKKKYKNIDLTQYDVVHELRKDAKKVRYAAVGFKSILPKKIRRKVRKEAKFIQEDLGSKTDHFVITELLKKHSETTTEIALQNSLNKLIDYYEL